LIQIDTIYFDAENEDMCKRSDPNALKQMEQAIVKEKFETFPTKSIIARRGNCSFVTKVRNAERAGASLLVVVDNRVEDVTNVIMGDDGTGIGLRIPAMLIDLTTATLSSSLPKK